MDIINNILNAGILIILIYIAVFLYIIICIGFIAHATRNTQNNLYEMEKRNEGRHKEQMDINREILSELKRLNSINNINYTNGNNNEYYR